MIELLIPKEMAEADRLTIEGGLSGAALMEAAGRAVADAVSGLAPAGARIAVLAGPGNNGGDGYVAAKVLRERGYAVTVLQFGGEPATTDARHAAAVWQGSVAKAQPASLDADLIVDALYGAGLSRRLEGEALALVEAVNASGVPVLAVDLPSGISGDTGAVMGGAVRAGRTVTFFRKKPGHVLFPGRAHCGGVQVAQIGIGERVLDHIRSRTFVNAPRLWQQHYPVPSPASHKYTRGHALIVSGAAASTGAARLAARGALRIGAGLVTIACPVDALPIVAAHSLAVMTRMADTPADLAALLADPRLNAVVLGPGGGIGEAMRRKVERALGGERGVVLDADALTSFAEHLPALRALLAARHGGSCIVTPHEGEFSRMFKDCSQVDPLASKLQRARAAAQLLGAVVILKGPDSVIAAPDQRAAVSDNAPPWLATAGSGDVLAGMAAGLLAQGMPPFEAACAAVWQHGEAGRELGPGLISEDIPEALPRVLRELL